MTAAIVKVENQQGTTYAGTFGDSLIERFAKFAGVSSSSRQTYTKCLKQLFKFFSANEITNPSRADLIDWLDDMKEDGKSASTIQLYLTATKIFFRWTAQEGIYPNIADHMKSGVKPSHNHKKDALSTDQCKELVKSVSGDDVKSLRDRAILSLMTTAGLRTCEVVRTDVGDIRFERGKVFLYVQGKGRSAADEKVLLSARGKVQASAPLFVSTSRRNKNARLETQTISRMVKKNLRFAGIELPKVQMILRHKSLNTTMIYAAAWERYQNDGEQILSDVIFKE